MIEPGSTTEVKLTYSGGNYVTTEDGTQIYMLYGVIERLDWKSPVWKPEVGQPAWCTVYADNVTVEAIGKSFALVTTTSGAELKTGISTLFPQRVNT